METKRILIVQTAFIGDVILITPIIRAVRQLYPLAVLDVMVVPAAAKLLENNPHVNSIIPYAKRRNSYLSMLNMLKILASNRYDMAISPHSSARTHLLLWLSRIPRRIGFDRGMLPWLLTDKVKHPTDRHKINKNLLLLKFISPQDFPMQTELFPGKADLQTADKHVGELSKFKLIAIAPGSIWATKCWLLESFTELAIKLIKSGFGIVLIGSEADKQKCNHIQTAINQDNPNAPVINLAGSTNLLESAAVIAKCSLMICNDSGALHLANAMQTTVFAIFGPTVQSIGYYPYRDGDRVFEVDLNCRPCGSHGADKCPLKHHKCMKFISADSVYTAVLESVSLKGKP
ncbi:MAG: lipopolysaccharide heptosyltransferase II [Candidatus Cloacimonetes bacterium]|nr:lipopolysaccharide heptosyltransferase II [Candidatus Cloacimonadota bacterium]